ncbi:MAG: hypothetical protein H7Z71_00150 [Moraxellaceae bacterium]|nr:hypothetical protein [Pseudobdellovibrionaceae bacterium]
MDRVLLVIDNVQFSGHLENTLRKLGYTTDALQNEYNLTERILSFNPDIIVARGTSHRLSAMKVGKRLKDNVKFLGKVILVFAPENIPEKAQLNGIKADLILEEPVTALRIATSILNLDSVDKPGMRDRLYKMVHDDPTFRDQEQSYLVQHGRSIEDELQMVRGSASAPVVNLTEIRLKIQNELQGYAFKQSAKIEAYNQQIEKTNIDLKKGLSKRKTKEENKANRKDWNIPASKEAQELDQARKDFTNELFKKKLT